MSTSDQNQAKPEPRGGGEQGQASAAPSPQGEASGGERAASPGGRHGRRRHGGGGRPEQSRQQPGRGAQQQRRAEATLNMDELRELTELFSAHGLTDFEFENADIRVRLSRNLAPAPVAPVAGGAQHAVAPTTQAQQHTPLAAMHGAAGSAPQGATAASEESAPAASSEPDEAELQIIPSPIVGTFYRAPSPQAEPFVRVGSTVENDTVVCIIEAMKLMNEIQAETKGTVAKIYVENGQAVEYGQPLFGIKK